MITIPTVALDEVTRIPILGFSTEGLSGKQCADMVIRAIRAGHRHIETADHWQNSTAISDAIGESGVPRADLFLSSKAWWSDLAPHKLRASLEKTLTELRVEYLDLYFIHWPNRTVPIAETLSVFREFIAEGRIRTMGVSNCTQHHLEDMRAQGADIRVVQCELHPTFIDSDLVSFCHTAGYHIMALSPLGAGKDLVIPVIREIAHTRMVTEAQVILAWIRMNGWLTTQTATAHPGVDEHIASLLLELTPEECERIQNAPKRERHISPPYADFAY